MHNVLFVSYSYPPAGNPQALRTAKLAKYLPQFGWSTTVLCAPRGYSDVGLTALGDHTDLPGVTEVQAAEPFLSVKSGAVRRFSREDRSVVKRFANYLLFPDRNVLWTGPAIYRGLEHSAVYRPDIIYSSSPPVSGHLVACALAKILKVPWVAEFRDPWTRWNPELRKGLRGKAATKLERFLYRQSDALVAISESLRHDIIQDLPANVPTDKVEVVPNGYDPSDFPAHPPSPPFGPGIFTLAYAGMFYGGDRDPRGLLDAISRLKEEGIATHDNFRLLIIGTPEEQVAAEVDARSLGDLVSYQGYQPYSRTISLLSSASACLLITHTHHPSLPVKVFDYLGTKLPILALTQPDFEVARIVQKARPSSLVSKPDDTASIARWLSTQIARHAAGSTDGGTTGRVFDPGGEQYTRIETARKVASILCKVSGKPSLVSVNGQ